MVQSSTAAGAPSKVSSCHINNSASELHGQPDRFCTTGVRASALNA
jgi:hypothetical protein